MPSLSWLDCAIPHDRIYAARHLLRSDAIMELVPNYSLPIEQLFTAATAILLQEQFECTSADCVIEHPSILLALVRLPKEGTNWPTWVPDYHNMKSEMERYFLQYDCNFYRPNFKPANNRMHVRWSSSDWRTIQIKGKPFSTIETILTTSTLPRLCDHHIAHMADYLNYAVALLRWYDRCKRFVHNTAGGDTRPTILKGLFDCGRWGKYAKETEDNNRAGYQTGCAPLLIGCSETLILPIEVFKLKGASVLNEKNASNGILIPSELISPPRDRLAAEYVELRWPTIILTPWTPSEARDPKADIDLYTVTSKDELPPDVFDVIVEVQSILGPIWRWGREPRMEERRVLCSFQTARGTRFGWVPPDSRPNDELCQFAGAPFPFVVRRVDGADARALVGDAWVYDVSDWKARSKTDPVRQAILASLWPHSFSLSRPRPSTLDYLLMRDRIGPQVAERVFERWQEENMVWIILQ